MAFVTIRDVAREAGRSVSTVSRVLSGTGRVSDATKKAIEQAIKDLNYIPDSRAQGMRSSKTRTVGLLVPDIRNQFFANLAFGIQKSLFANGYSTLIGTSSENIEQQDAFLRSLLAQHIDGVIVVPQGESPTLSLLEERNLPLIFADRSVASLPNVPVVNTDPATGLEAALKRIKELGHTEVAFIPGPSMGSSTLRQRAESFEAIAQPLFGATGTFVAPNDLDGAALDAALYSILEKKVTAIIFGYSPDAIAAIYYLQHNGIKLGTDISIVSFDELPLFELVDPQVAVISQKVATLGSLTTQLFLDMIKGIPPVSRRIPTEFIPRASLGRPVHRRADRDRPDGTASHPITPHTT